jgi:hypothetical protein
MSLVVMSTSQLFRFVDSRIIHMAAVQEFYFVRGSMAITNGLLDHVKFGMEIDNKYIYTLSLKYCL